MIILYFYAFLNNQQPRQGVLLNIFQLDKPEQKNRSTTKSTVEVVSTTLTTIPNKL
jgi:hypothetical protein